MLQIIVEDATGTAKMTLFNQAAIQLLKKDASTLRAQMVKVTPSNAYLYVIIVFLVYLASYQLCCFVIVFFIGRFQAYISPRIQQASLS